MAASACHTVHHYLASHCVGFLAPLPHQAIGNTLHCPAAPLELDNGGDMMDLVCTSYATPSEKLEGIDREADDAPEDYDFSKPYICYIAPACSALGTTVPSG